MKKLRLINVALTIVLGLNFFSVTSISAKESGTWVLVDTINPAGDSGILLHEGSGNKKGSFIKGNVNLPAGTMMWHSHIEGIDIETREKQPSQDYISRMSFDLPSQELIPGDTVSLNVVRGDGNWDGLYFFGAYDPKKTEGYGALDVSRWTEYRTFDERYDPKPWSFNFVVPDIYEGELRIRFSSYHHREIFVEWVYRPSEGPPLDLTYSPPLAYFEPGMGANIGFAGELVATLKDEDGKGIEGKTILFFIDKEVPGANEPGKNLFDVLAYEVAEGTGSLGSIEIHEFLTKRIVTPELDESLFREDRIFLGNGAKTDSNGEAIINVIEYDIIDPKKFSGELIDQRVAFLDKGKVSGTIIAGVYDEETKFIVSQVALEIEYQAMAKILQITGEGRSDDTEIGRKYPGKVRVKRILALPKFDYTPVEEGFLLMPGDIVDIDGNAAVEIAWINGDKVIARVPDKIQVGNVIEPYEPAESQIFMLSSAYDSGFLTTGEKIYNTVFGFGAKKGVELLVESIPYVGKLIKEGGALVIEIHEDLKDIDLSQSDIVTRIRIRSKVIIDNTGEELKVYNLEGSPDIKTVGGGEITLAEGKMVVVSNEGVLGEVQTFNVKELEEEFYETALAIQRTDSSGSGAKGGSSSTGVIIGVIAVVVVALALLVMRKRVKKA